MNYTVIKIVMKNQKNQPNILRKMTNSQKILEYLQQNPKEISNKMLSEKIGIDKTNIPREIKKLEKQGYPISKRYEQSGRAKYVWFQLTTRQKNKTNSQNNKKIIPIKKQEKQEKEGIKEQCPHCKKFFKRLSSHKCPEDPEIIKNSMNKDQEFFQYIRTISGDLVIALNYAINTIKNKPEVKAKKNGATRYDYFKNWNQYRDFFKRLDREMKIKIGIIKEEEQ